MTTFKRLKYQKVQNSLPVKINVCGEGGGGCSTETLAILCLVVRYAFPIWPCTPNLNIGHLKQDSFRDIATLSPIFYFPFDDVPRPFKFDGAIDNMMR